MSNVPFVTEESVTQLRQDLANIFQDTIYPDVAIICGQSRMLCHRVILAYRSKFFQEILSNHRDKDANGMVEIDLAAYDINVAPESFEIILKYLYTGEIYVTHDNCLDVYSLSRQLKLESAERVCNQYLDKMKNGSQVCGLLKAARERGEMELFNQCMKSFEEKTSECLSSSLFLSIPSDIIISILKSNKISCMEKQLFDAIIKWWGCNKDDILPNASKSEQDEYLVKNYLYYIRYPLMDPDDIIEIEKMNLLPTEYILQALRYHAIPEVVEGSDSEIDYNDPNFRLRSRTEALHTFSFDPKKKGSDMVLSNDDNTVEIAKPNIQAYQIALANKPLTGGVHFFEITVDQCTTSSHIMVGISTGTGSLRQWLGQDKTGWSWFGYNGTKYHGGTCPTYNNAKFTKGDVIGVKVDLRKDGILSFFKNGVFIGVAFTGIPTNTTYYPAVSLRTTGDMVSIRSGSGMKYLEAYAPYKVSFDK